MEWQRLLCGDRIRMYKGSGNSGDLRTEFEKDYHRIIGSASFRRLQDKTQVFPLDKSDFVRTRLTHSLEVSSFAKSLGQNISKKILQDIKDPSFKESYQADICDILQCAGLLHDIGNPPFGHFGETVIREWFIKNLSKLTYGEKTLEELLLPQMKADLYHFEGNTQALRLVTKLHYLVDEHGMNLTKGLLGTIIKYPVSSLEINKESGDIKDKKMGYYYAERDIFADLQETLGTHGKRHPLTFVLEAADDIAYKTADIEDSFKKGRISYGQLIQELKEGGVGRKEDDEYLRLVETLEERYNRALDKGIAQPEAYAVQNWVIRIQGRMIACATYGFTKNYAEILNGTYKKDLFSGTNIEHMAYMLGDIAYRYAFISKPILKLEVAAETIMNFLLDKFVDAAIYYDTDRKLNDVQEKMIALISDNYKAIYNIYAKDKNEIERLYLRLLLVTDFICGMTDSYAKLLYQELNGLLQ
ncbi:MAG: deoxyguanosinetriphosphate triphosphohydrolase [Clostridiales bacterium]|nr:deoxyguanosinetriphosphate triphosphohydrolase [Clostridiales bacterium]